MECVIALVTHSSYIDICNNFVSLFRANWPDCPFKLVGAVIGEDKIVEGIETVYVENGDKLTDCICRVKELYPADFYLCFLGDAFISSKVDHEKVVSLLNELKQKEAQYCRLFPMREKNRATDSDLARQIKYSDVYGHSFVAFLTTPKFIDENLHGKTDLEFEKKYLEMTSDSELTEIFNDDYVVTRDIFHIIPTVVKGKWDRVALKQVRRQNPDIRFSSREYLSICEQTRLILINALEGFIPGSLRGKIKKLLSHMGFKFSTQS